MAIESSFIPFPSEVVVPPAAYKAAVSGEMNVFLVVLFATIGANIGALINYYLAKWLGRPIIYKFANSRFGHMCLIDEAKVQNAEVYFEKHGALSTFIGRLIPAVRQLISIPAGLAKMKLSVFLIYTTLGAGIWNAILAAIGYYLSTVPGIETEEQLLAKVTEYSHELGYIFIGIGVFIVAYLAYQGMRKGK
jgi:membrane protein DedA with SNARE-associated domain